MADTDTAAARTQDLRDSVKWIGTAVIGITSAIVGTTVLTQITSAPQANIPLCIALGCIAMFANATAAFLCVWAITAAEPRLGSLVPDLAAIRSHSRASTERLSKPQRRLKAELDHIGVVAALKYENAPAIAAEVRRLHSERAKAVEKSRLMDSVGDEAKQTVSRLDSSLSKSYNDLAEVGAAVHLLRTQKRTRISLPIIAGLGVVVLATMIPFSFLAKPSVTAAAPITEPTPVSYLLYIEPALAESPNACSPASSGEALAVGGTWTQPILIFTSASSLGSCVPGERWTWTADAISEVLITP